MIDGGSRIDPDEDIILQLDSDLSIDASEMMYHPNFDHNPRFEYDIFDCDDEEDEGLPPI